MQCKFVKPNNEQCNANAMIESEFCFTHNPDTQEERALAVMKGGLAPKKNEELLLEAISIKKVEDLLSLLEDTINGVRTQPITNQRANTIGFLVNVFVRVLEGKENKETQRKLDNILYVLQTKHN